MPTGRMRHELTGVQVSRLHQARHETGKDVVRNRQQNQVGVGSHLRHRKDRDSGQQGLGSQAGEVGDGRDGHHLVTCASQR